MVEWAEATKKQLRRLHRGDLTRIISDGEALSQNPRPSGVEQKRGPWAGYYSIRVGIHYRIAYIIDDTYHKVVIAKVGPRENFWKQPPG